MEDKKEIKINVPEGYVIDEENSTFTHIKFKKKETRFGDYDGTYELSGFYVDTCSNIKTLVSHNDSVDKNIFHCRGAAVSALAFAQLTQIREHEYNRYGIKPSYADRDIYAIFYATDNELLVFERCSACSRLETYLAFDTREHAELFLRENKQLIKDYFMMS